MPILDYTNRKLYTHNYNIEANEIWNATQPELDKQTAEVMRIFNNTRVSNIDLEKHPEDLIIWEEIYGILPNTIIDDIEARREDVLAHKRRREPFTETWLIYDYMPRWFPDRYVLEMPGVINNHQTPESGMFDVEVDYTNLHLYINIVLPDVQSTEAFRANRTIQSFMAAMRGIIPANILFLARRRLGPVAVDPAHKAAVSLALHRVHQWSEPGDRPNIANWIDNRFDITGFDSF